MISKNWDGNYEYPKVNPNLVLRMEPNRKLNEESDDDHVTGEDRLERVK